MLENSKYRTVDLELLLFFLFQKWKKQHKKVFSINIFSWNFYGRKLRNVILENKWESEDSSKLFKLICKKKTRHIIKKKYASL